MDIDVFGTASTEFTCGENVGMSGWEEVQILHVASLENDFTASRAGVLILKQILSSPVKPLAGDVLPGWCLIPLYPIEDKLVLYCLLFPWRTQLDLQTVAANPLAAFV